MNSKKLEELLKEEESIYLEFKESLDLESREGKGKFLKDLLALVNSPVNQSFLVVGIEDKTKKLLGFTGITEERLQQIVSRYCRPPIDLEFHSVDYQGVLVGVIQIFHRYKFHTLKESYKYQSNGKDVEIREKVVFIRHGSTVDEATPDEVIDMAQSEAPDLTAVVSGLDKIAYWLDEIASNGSRHHFEPTFDHSRRFIEPTFISMICAMILAWLWSFTISFPVVLAALPISMTVTIISATIRVVDFGVRRIITVSFSIGFVLSLWFLYGIGLLGVAQWMVDAPILGILLNGFAGTIFGFLISILLEFWHPLGN
jgi:hypothetical protein